MSIYKDCDIRGIYGEEFDEKDAYLIGRAVGTCRGESGWRWEGISACQHRF